VAAIPPELVPLAPTPATNIRRLETTSASVTLKPVSNRKYVLDEILADGPHYADILVGTTTITRVPLRKNDCIFTPKPGEASPSIGILNVLRRYVLDKWIAGTSKEPLTIVFDTAPTLASIFYYDIPEAEKLGEEIPSAWTEVPFVSIMTHSAAVDKTGVYNFDEVIVPMGFPAVKSGEFFPGGVKFELKLLAFAAAKNVGTEFQYLHVWLHGKELFHPEDHKGLSVKTAYNECKMDVTKLQAFIMPSGAVYMPGYQLTVQGDAVYDGTNVLAAKSSYVYLMGVLSKV
jgi:hypothetical protein